MTQDVFFSKADEPLGIILKTGYFYWGIDE